MTISRKAEYALRATVILASAPANSTLQIQEMARTGKIPLKFLEQILLVLKRGGLLRSKRGVGGGYQLDQPARQISIGTIIELIDGDRCALSTDAGSPDDEFPGSRGLRESLREIDTMVNERLESISIEDILIRDDPDAMLAFGI